MPVKHQHTTQQAPTDATDGKSAHPNSIKNAEEFYQSLWPGHSLLGATKRHAVTNKQLLCALARMYHRELIIAVVLFVLQALAILCTPLCIYIILLWHSGEFGTDRDARTGYLLAAAFAVIQISGFFILNRMHRTARLAGIRSQATIEAVLYARLLATPVAGPFSPTTGEVVSLFGADVDALVHVWSGLLGLLLGPLELLIVVAQLYYFVQWAVFGAIAVVGCVLLLYSYVGKKIDTIAQKQADLTAERFKVLKEFMQGMKGIKASAAEHRYVEQIMGIRAKETQTTRALNLRMGVLNVCGDDSVDVISWVVVAVFTLAMRHTLLPSSTFTVWIVLGILHGKIFHFPGYFDEVMAAWTAVTNVADFLSRDTPSVLFGAHNNAPQQRTQTLQTTDCTDTHTEKTFATTGSHSRPCEGADARDDSWSNTSQNGSYQVSTGDALCDEVPLSGDCTNLHSPTALVGDHQKQLVRVRDADDACSRQTSATENERPVLCLRNASFAWSAEGLKRVMQLDTAVVVEPSAAADETTPDWNEHHMKSVEHTAVPVTREISESDARRVTLPRSGPSYHIHAFTEHSRKDKITPCRGTLQSAERRRRSLACTPPVDTHAGHTLRRFRHADDLIRHHAGDIRQSTDDVHPPKRAQVYRTRLMSLKRNHRATFDIEVEAHVKSPQPHSGIERKRSCRYSARVTQEHSDDSRRQQHAPPAEQPYKTSNNPPGECTGMNRMVPLHKLDINVPEGSLMAIVGVVGSGKSTLLKLLMGEVPPSAGQRMCTVSRIAYCAQQPWIFHGTLRDNILLGETFCAKRYTQVVSACALHRDFDAQPEGDQTVVQADSLSGGQRQRIGIARAAYSSARLVVMDDPFSALDTVVATHVLTHCVRGLMRHKTVLFTTNYTKSLEGCDLIGVLCEGSVVVDAPANFTNEDKSNTIYSRNPGDTREKATHILRKLTESYASKNPWLKVKHSGDGIRSTMSLEKTTTFNGVKSPDGTSAEKVDDLEFYGIDIDDVVEDHTQDPTLQTVSIEDNDETVTVSHRLTKRAECHGLIWHLASAVGGFHWLLFIVLTLLAEESVSEYQLWLLATWSDEGVSGDITHSATHRYVLYYAALVGAEILVAYIRQIVVSAATTRTADCLHRQLVDMVQSAPLSYFTSESTPAWYILDLFARDLSRIDRSMFMGVEYLLIPITYWLAISTATAIVLPWTALSFLISSVGIYFLLRIHRQKSKVCKRWLSRTKQPVVQCVADTEQGRTTIRAFGCQETFLRRFGRYLDDYTKASTAVSVAMATTASLADVAGSVFNIGVVLAIVVSKDDITTGEAGFTLTNAAFSAFAVNLMVARILGMRDLGSTRDRLLHVVAKAPREAPQHIPTTQPLATWPSEGHVEVHNMTLTHNTHTSPAVSGISFKCLPGEKITIVGRTGSGKSSVLMGLMRLTELSSGCVVIDGVDVSTVGLYNLRSQVTLLTQDPLFFSGTLRYNLDASAVLTDDEIWTALAHTQMQHVVRALPQQLSTEVTPAGAPFSTGQLQLLNVARALLSNHALVLLDEPTASVDNVTAALIQAVIQTHFRAATVIQVSHRLDLVGDSDRILVMDRGRIIEQGSPSELLQRNDSVFHMLMDSYTVSAAQKSELDFNMVNIQASNTEHVSR